MTSDVAITALKAHDEHDATSRPSYYLGHKITEYAIAAIRERDELRAKLEAAEKRNREWEAAWGTFYTFICQSRRSYNWSDKMKMDDLDPRKPAPQDFFIKGWDL